jgi:hypothetical protein
MTAAFVPHTFRTRPIGVTDVERVRTSGKHLWPQRGALLGATVSASDGLGITIDLVTADNAVQEWERES